MNCTTDGKDELMVFGVRLRVHSPSHPRGNGEDQCTVAE